MEEMGSYRIYWLSKIQKAEPRTGNFLCSEDRVRNHDILRYIYIYIYIYTHTHTYIHINTCARTRTYANTHTQQFSVTHAGSILCGHFPVKSQITSRRVQIFMAKVELLPCLIKCHATKTDGEMAVQLHTLLTMAVCGGMWSVSCPKTLTVD